MNIAQAIASVLQQRINSVCCREKILPGAKILVMPKPWKKKEHLLNKIKVLCRKGWDWFTVNRKHKDSLESMCPPQFSVIFNGLPNAIESWIFRCGYDTNAGNTANNEEQWSSAQRA